MSQKRSKSAESKQSKTSLGRQGKQHSRTRKATPPSATLEIDNKSAEYESIIDKLKQENESFMVKINDLYEANDILRNQYATLKSDIVTESNDMNLRADKLDASLLVHEEVVSLLRQIIHIAKHPPPTEARMEDMETRITQQNAKLTELTGNCIMYENVFNEIYKIRDIDMIHDKIEEAFILSGKISREAPFKPKDLSCDPAKVYVTPSTFHQLQMKSNSITLIAPPRKLPGNTHLAHMNIDLKNFLCNELNWEKKTGPDWRLLASRLGVPIETVEMWRHTKVVSPMHRLLAVWLQSCNATVRMLHRHLASSQMNAVLLARRIEDFYLVD